MTREEAINGLHGMKADKLNLDDFYTKNQYEALEMGIKALEQQPSEDCISRQAVISTIYDNKSDFKNDFSQGFFADRIRELPPVTPQPKMGRWIDVFGGCECSECGCLEGGYSDYCSNCGAKMKEAEE